MCVCLCVSIEQTASSYLAGVSGGLRLTLVPSAGLCTTVVWASWGEVGDTLPCREGDGWEWEEDGGGGGGGGGTRTRCRGARLTHVSESPCSDGTTEAVENF